MSKAHTKTSYKYVWITILMILIALYAGLFWYMQTNIKKTTYDLSSAEIAYNQRDTVEATQNTIKELHTDIQKVNEHFVSVDGEVDFINDLEQNAALQNVDIETTYVALEEPVEDIPYGEVLKINLEVSGDWNDVMQYVRLIEGLPYNIWISSVVVSLEENDVVAEPEQEPAFVWEAIMSLNVLKHPAI